MDHRFAILVDGGFLTRKLYSKLKRRPEVDDVVSAIERLKNLDSFANYELLRVYYYDATPATGVITHPITGVALNLAETDVYRRNKSFLQKLELQGDVALRLGETSSRGYKIKHDVLDGPDVGSRCLQGGDFIPDIEQKGVDLRIGLDIARLSLRQLVQTIVVVTGDSDLIPAFKFARREGVRVLLDHMDHGVKRELKAHTDGLI